MLDPFVRCYGLAQHGEPGLACDDDGLALGPTTLAKMVRDAAGRRCCRLRPRDEVAQALRLAYGPVSDPVVERWCRGLVKVGELLARGEYAHARIYSVLLGFPKIAPAGMAKLARATALQKYYPDWDTESRVPSKNPGGGEWADDSGNIEIAGGLRCDGIAAGCQSGGSYGTSAMYQIDGKNLCRSCAVKWNMLENESGGEQVRQLEPYLIGGSGRKYLAPDRESKIRAIKVGDIFHAESPNGASMPCQALTITDKTIEAQRMFMPGEILRFDRTTGLEQGKKGGAWKTVIPLPDDMAWLILRVYMISNVYQRSDGTTFLKDSEEIAPAKIDSVAPLPDDIRDVLLKLDHRNRTSNAPGSAKLSEPEKKALIFIQHHFRNNQI